MAIQLKARNMLWDADGSDEGYIKALPTTFAIDIRDKDIAYWLTDSIEEFGMQNLYQLIEEKSPWCFSYGEFMFAVKEEG